MPNDWRTLAIGLVLIAIAAPLSVSLVRRILAESIDGIGALTYGIVLISALFLGGLLFLDGVNGRQLSISVGFTDKRG